MTSLQTMSTEGGSDLDGTRTVHLQTDAAAPMPPLLSVALVYHSRTSSTGASTEGGLDHGLGPHSAPAHGQRGTFSAANVDQAGA